MKYDQSLILVMGVGLLMLAGLFAGYSALRLSRAEASLVQSAELMGQAEGYARQIEAHRATPQRVSEGEMELTFLARLIEHAADQAQVPRQSLDRIWPQPPRRVGKTAYQRKSTQLLVRDVSLPQAIMFLHGLATGPSPLSIDALRLSAPRTATTTIASTAGNARPTTAEAWTLEVTVSHLLYQPSVTPGSTSVAQRN